MKAIDIYHNVVADEINDSVDHGLNLKKTVFSNFINLILRKLTTQKLRLTPLRIKYLFKIPYFSKEFGLDYLEYVLKNDPEMPYKFFPKNDWSEIDYFIKIMLKGAFFEGYTEKDFGSRWSRFEKIRSEVGNNLKFNFFKNYFSLFGFKSSVYPDTGIFPDNYHLEILKKDNYDTCLDIGAYIGDSAYIINKMLKPKTIYAFEPDVNNKIILSENIKLNKLTDKVIPVKFATGSKSGTAYFESVNASSSLNNKKTGNKVSIITIDDFVKVEKIKKLDLIKMDIEGAELDTILGARASIAKFKPDLVIAIYHRGKHFFELPNILKNIVPGYKFRFVALSGSSPVIERFLMASTSKI